jgi:hypothetical protein
MTTGGTANERCTELRDALTEVALGVADGTTRGAVMAHLATCESCREELSSLAAAADELLLLVPEREPSAGFEGRVLAQLVPERDPRSPSTRAPAAPNRPASVRRHGARRAVLAAALGVGLVAVGGTGVWLATAPDRDLAAAYRTTLDTADGRYLAAADLTTDAGGPPQSVGTVFFYEGNPSWAYLVVRDAGPAASYDVVVTVDAAAVAADGADAADGTDRAGRYPYGPGADGPDLDRPDPGDAGPGGADPDPGTREIALGQCVVTADVCSAGGVLDVAVPDVVSIRLTTPTGATWATASPR